MPYVGIDWAYRRAAWCALGEGGAIGGEGVVPADEDGLVKLVVAVGPEVRACVEMMSGAVWVRGRLAAAGWAVAVAHAQGPRRFAVGVQDGQGRRAVAGRAVPARPGGGGVDPVVR